MKEQISDFTHEKCLDVPKSEFPQNVPRYFVCNTFKNMQQVYLTKVF